MTSRTTTKWSATKKVQGYEPSALYQKGKGRKDEKVDSLDEVQERLCMHHRLNAAKAEAHNYRVQDVPLAWSISMLQRHLGS